MTFKRHDGNLVDAILEGLYKLFQSRPGCLEAGLTACQLPRHTSTDVHYNQGHASANGPLGATSRCIKNLDRGIVSRNGQVGKQSICLWEIKRIGSTVAVNDVETCSEARNGCYRLAIQQLHLLGKI